MITPRDYQVAAREAVLTQWREVVSTLVVMPTGSGKTVLFADIINTLHPGRAMVVAHRRELITQARDKIEMTTGLQCEIEMADLCAATNLFTRTPVVVASVQTLNTGPEFEKRIRRFKPEDFALLIIDEAHHATANSYRFILDWFKRNPKLRILGVTATPDRADEEALGQIFDTVAFDYEILDAVHDGWLVDICQHYIPVSGLDYSHIRTTAGDLNGGDLAKVMEMESNIQGVCHPSLEVMFALPPHTLDSVPVDQWCSYLTALNRKPRRTIVFTASVAQAENCSNILNRAVPGIAEWVCGETNAERRKGILDRFQSGDTAVVCNCGVLTEGFDNPHVEVVVMARPTKSRALYSQMLGRATRPLPGLVDQFRTAEERVTAISYSPKPFCRVVDFVGNSGRHKLVTSADILGGKVSDRAVERAIANAIKGNKPVRMARTLDNAELELEKEKREAAERARRIEEQVKSRLVAKVKFGSVAVSPFDALNITPVKQRGWDSGKSITLKQRQLLLRQGVDPDKMNYAESRQLLNEFFRRWNNKLCTIKQATTIKKYRPGIETRNLTMKEASRILDEVKKDGWKRITTNGKT